MRSAATRSCWFWVLMADLCGLSCARQARTRSTSTAGLGRTLQTHGCSWTQIRSVTGALTDALFRATRRGNALHAWKCIRTSGSIGSTTIRIALFTGIKAGIVSETATAQLEVKFVSGKHGVELTRGWVEPPAGLSIGSVARRKRCQRFLIQHHDRGRLRHPYHYFVVSTRRRGAVDLQGCTVALRLRPGAVRQSK